MIAKMIADMHDTTLIGGPYTPPNCKRGDRTFCFYRDCDVVIISWADGPIRSSR